jgi:hypothetical protein
MIPAEASMERNKTTGNIIIRFSDEKWNAGSVIFHIKM